MATTECTSISHQKSDLRKDWSSSMTSHSLISDEVRDIFQWVFYSVLCELVDVFGTVANIINIICFVKLGFKDAVNISLLGLAISDLGSLVSLIWANICFNPALLELDLPFEPTEVQFLTGAGLHVVFTRVTSCITAFITLERCLCVTMPLKVRTLFTRTRVTAIIASIFICDVSSMLPLYCVNKLAKKYSPQRNKTLVGLVYTDNRNVAEAVAVAFGGLFFQMGAFVTVVLCTSILIIKLRTHRKWRQTSSALQQMDSTSNRDQKVTSMVIAISIFFIVCFVPICFFMAGMILEPEFSIQGKFRNLFISLASLCFLLESTNSAMNVFIYYHMSSKFRNVLRHLLLGRKV